MVRNGDPVSLEGKKIQWLWKESDQNWCQHESTFISQELFKQHDRYAFHVGEEPHQVDTWSQPSQIELSASSPFLETLASGRKANGVEQILPSEVVQALKSEEIPEELWGEVLVSEELRQSILSQTISEIHVASAHAHAAVHPRSTHSTLEEELRLQKSHLSSRPGSSNYSGPLFAYQIDKDIEFDETNEVDHIKDDLLISRRAPINVAWNDDLNRRYSGISNEMTNNGWNSRWVRKSLSRFFSYSARYVLVTQASGSSLKREDDDVGKSTTTSASPEQWHCRIFNVPQSMDSVFVVAGQVHRDPVDHDKLASRSWGKQSWEFARSRREIAADWQQWGFSSSDPYIGNEDAFNSSNGKQSQISQ